MFSARRLIEKFAGRDTPAAIELCNDFRLNLHGAERRKVGELRDGRIRPVDCYVKGEAMLPAAPPFDGIIGALGQTSDAMEFIGILRRSIVGQVPPALHNAVFTQHLQALETMIQEGWVIAKINKKRGHFRIDRDGMTQLRDTAEGIVAIETAKRKRAAAQGGR